MNELRKNPKCPYLDGGPAYPEHFDGCMWCLMLNFSDMIELSAYNLRKSKQTMAGEKATEKTAPDAPEPPVDNPPEKDKMTL